MYQVAIWTREFKYQRWMYYCYSMSTWSPGQGPTVSRYPLMPVMTDRDLLPSEMFDLRMQEPTSVPVQTLCSVKPSTRQCSLLAVSWLSSQWTVDLNTRRFFLLYSASLWTTPIKLVLRNDMCMRSPSFTFLPYTDAGVQPHFMIFNSSSRLLVTHCYSFLQPRKDGSLISYVPACSGNRNSWV